MYHFRVWHLVQAIVCNRMSLFTTETEQPLVGMLSLQSISECTQQFAS